MITNEIREKLAKVYALVNHGADGEKQAAKAAMDRLIKKYRLDEIDIDKILEQKYRFKYSNLMELYLFHRILHCLFTGKQFKLYKYTGRVREIGCSLEYTDFVIIESAYEYFRKHMNSQYRKTVLPIINRCRSAKTKNARRLELQTLFAMRYCIESELYVEGELETLELSKMSKKEIADRQVCDDIQGGKYHTQVTTGLYLEQ